MIQLKYPFKETVSRNIFFLGLFFVSSFLALLVAGYVLHFTVQDIRSELANQYSRSIIGKSILKNLLLIDLDVHRMIMLKDPRQCHPLKEDILQHTAVITRALNVLQKGGEFSEKLPTNFYGRDEIIEKVVYKPVGQSYNIDVIDLMPKVMEIEDNVHDLVNNLKLHCNASLPSSSGLQKSLKISTMQLHATILRTRETSNKIAFDTNNLIHKLKQECVDTELFSEYLVAIISILLLTGCSIFFSLIFKRINAIILQRQQNAEALKHAKESITAILSALPVGVVVVRPDYSISRINRAGLELLEAEDEDVVIGRHCHEIFCLSGSYRCPILESCNSGFEGEIELNTLRGNKVHVIKKAMTINLDNEQMILEAFIDISDRIKAEQELKESRELFQTVFESLPAGIVIIDAETRTIRNVNKTALKMIGGKRDKVIGNICHKHICPADEGRCPILDLSMRVDTSERVLLTASGKEKEILKSVEVLRMAGRKVLVESFVDIGQLKDVERQLIQAKEQADQASEAKSMFLANMSHEVRTPMNGILGLCHLVLQTDMTSRQQEYVEKILTTSQSLLAILNDILDFSRIEAGKLTTEHVPFDLQEILHRTTALMEMPVLSKGLQLILDVDEDIPPILMGDPLRLGQVLTNLTNNAVKFTEEGKITIKVEKEALQKNGVSLKFSVRDTGIGIPPEKIESLFGSFEQVDGTTTRKYGGTGLGLAICKRLVELMGGSIGARSSPEQQGSEFFFHLRFQRAMEGTEPVQYLPARTHVPHLQADKSAPRPKKNKLANTRIFKGKRCLIVDDMPLNRKVLQEIVRHMGLIPKTAVNGLEALKSVHQHSFDIVFMDVQMPEMDGFQATQKIRSNQQFAPLPIIALTAHALAEDKEKCLKAGMNDFLAKPIQPDELFQVLSRWLSTNQETDHAVTKQETSRASELHEPPLNFSIKGLDLEKALETMMGKVDLLRTILVTFARENRSVSEKLTQELEKTDLKALRNLSHSIKGQAGQIRANLLYEQSSKLEQAALNNDIDECQVLLPEVRREVARIIKAVDDIFPQEPSPQRHLSPVDPLSIPNEIQQQLTQLSALLAGNDLAAETMMEKIRNEADASLLSSLEAINRYIEILEFEKADRLLRELLLPNLPDDDDSLKKDSMDEENTPENSLPRY